MSRLLRPEFLRDEYGWMIMGPGWVENYRQANEALRYFFTIEMTNGRLSFGLFTRMP